ncbi:MAG: pilin [Candidatus Altiarchaeota archaeon]
MYRILLAFQAIRRYGRLLLVIPLALNASAGGTDMAELNSLNEGLVTVAAALGVLMISIQGLKWVTSDTPQDRADAKKGLEYILIGLLVVYLAGVIVCGLYGVALSAYSISCVMNGVVCECDP